MSILNMKGVLVGVLATITIDGVTGILYSWLLRCTRVLSDDGYGNSHWGMNCLPEA